MHAQVLAGERLEGLELILSGALAPIDGYCLPGDKPEDWPVSANLAVDPRVAESVHVGDTIELCDFENTPLAELHVTGLLAGADTAWLAGSVSQLRMPAHGIAREHRVKSGGGFDGRVVVVVQGVLRAADLLRAIEVAGARPIDFVVAGTPGEGGSGALVAELRECARMLSGARVWFVPAADLGSDDDIVRAVVGVRNPDVVLDFRRASEADGQGAVILFTGLSGAGKSTVARALVERVSAAGAHRAVLLDGDHIRHELASELGFGREDRDKNLQRIAWVGARVAEAGGLAVCAPIAPFESSRAGMRAKVEPAYPFIVVYVSTPIEVAEQRDRKGLYKKARAGLISDFTGIGSPYEEPFDADVVIDTSKLDVEGAVDSVIGVLEERGLL